MKLGFLSKIFEGALSIEKTYNQCDAALSELKAYNQKRQEADFRISNEGQSGIRRGCQYCYYRCYPYH